VTEIRTATRRVRWLAPTAPPAVIQNPRRTRVLGLAAALGAMVIIAVLYLPLSGVYDLDVFLRAGSAVLHGHDPYPAIGTPEVYSGSAYVYPYLYSWVFAPLAALPVGAGEAVGVGLMAVVVALTASWARPRQPAVPALVLMTAFTVTGLQLGTLSPLLLAGLIGLWLLRDRPVLFALLAAPLLAAKVFLLPVLLWPLLTRRWRTLGLSCAGIALLLGIGFGVGPLSAHEYLRLLSSLGSHEAATGMGMISRLRAAGTGPQLAQGAAFAVAAGLVAAAWWQSRRHPERADGLLFGAAVLASLLMTPVLWSHYLALLLAPLLVVPRRITAVAVFAVASWLIARPHHSGVALTVTGAVIAAVLGFIAVRAEQREDLV
jgi:alpha-1,2-mannosyltransferase